MRLLNSLAFPLFLIFFTFKPCWTLSQSNYLITDLESLDSSGFTTEANSWTYKTVSCPSCIFSMPAGSECNPDQIVYGGPDAPSGAASQVFGKSYSISGAAWSYSAAEFEMWAFATSELTNPASATIVTVKLISGSYYGTAMTLISSCSTDYKSTSGSQIKFIYKYRVKSAAPISPTNTIDLGILKSTAATSIDSIGLRNVKIYNMGSSSGSAASVNFPCWDSQFWNGAGCGACQSACSSCTGSNQGACTVCKTTAYNYGNGVCLATACSGAYQLITGTKDCTKKCSTGFYWARDVSCRESCEEPLVQSVDANGGASICSSPCSNAAQFVYPDRSCSSTCDPLLKEQSETTLKLCLNPCQTSSEFVYPNGDCENTCPTPLSGKTEKNIKYCESPCPNTAKYLYKDQSCSSTCNLPLIESTENGIFSCSSPCSDSTKYLYPDGSCLDECPTPFSKKTENNLKFCYSTCSAASKYVNPDGSCTSACDSLLKENTKNGIFSCSSPCEGSTKYLYPDGSCQDTCPNPLSEKNEKDVKYCESPCSDATHFVYSDKSCSSQCPYPLSRKTERGAKYCFSPCDDYLYKDGSCLQNCNPPHIKSQSYNVNQCLSPCEDPSKGYFYEANQVCKSTCTFPYESKTVDSIKICSKKSQMTSNVTSQMTAQEIEETKNLVSSIKSQAKVTEAGMKAASALNSGSQGFAWLAGQASMLFYIRYINLNYTPKLKLVFYWQDVNPFDFTVGIDMPEGLKEKLRDRELLEVFERYEIHSNFFYNSWDMLSTSLLILGIILALSVVKIFTAKYTKVDRVLAGVLGSLKWNTLLMVICGSFGKLFFDTSMQFQAGSADSAWEIFSIILAIFMLFVGIAILALNGKVARDLWRSRNDKSAREGMEKKWANFELFFESCERNSLASFSCMGILLGRTLLFNLIIANLYNHPLIQSILINIITFGMAGYLIKKRPLKNFLEFAQILLSEVLVVIVNICALIIAIMDHAEIEGQSLRNDLCNTIVIIFFVFTSFSLAFLVIQVLVAFFFFVRILRRLRAQGQLHLRGVVNALFFGNEENPAVEEKNNGKNIPVQIRPQIREVSDVKEDLNMTNSIIHPINETKNPQETSGIFIPHRPFKRRITNASRKSRPSFNFLDRSAVEILPSEGSFNHTLGLGDWSPGLNQEVTLESNHQDSVLQTVDSESRDLGLPGTISQFRKMRNYLRRNRDRRQPE